MVAFQNDDFYFLMSVALESGRPVIQLHRAAGPGQGADPELVASAPLQGPLGAPLYLRIQAERDSYDFYYGYSPDEWTPLHRDLDGKLLSTRTSGGFVGVTFGLYAFSESQ